LNLDRYERVEESVVDLYSAVRNAYFQRRAAAIRE
jgi:ABC-type transporter lipoprotein component MlaA